MKVLTIIGLSYPEAKLDGLPNGKVKLQQAIALSIHTITRKVNMRWIEVDGDATLPTVCWESCSECIHDNTAPVITTCPASREVFLTGNCELNVPDLISEIVATDNYTSVEELTITQEPAAGTLLPSGEGTTHAVIVTVDDKNGNTATCEVTLTGDDNIAPEVITNPLTVYLDASGQASITAEDIDNGSHDACGTIGLSVDIVRIRLFECWFKHGNAYSNRR